MAVVAVVAADTAEAEAETEDVGVGPSAVIRTNSADTAAAVAVGCSIAVAVAEQAERNMKGTEERMAAEIGNAGLANKVVATRDSVSDLAS